MTRSSKVNNNTNKGQSVMNTRKRSLSTSASSTSTSRSTIETRSSQKKRQTLSSSDDSDISMSSPQASSSDTNSTTTIASPIPQRIFVQRNVPAFLNKLYSMVNDPSTDSLIHWSKDGKSFIVEGHEQFARSVLPRFYKHNTFASFVRQLNMYDFHKIPHLQQGVLISDSKHERWEFTNPNFQRGHPEMLVLVTRKRNRERGADDEEVSLASLVKNISAIRQHQISISNELHSMQQDKAVLWEDTLTSREKHQRHQEIIAKILQFLTAVFSNGNNVLTPSTAGAFQQLAGGTHNLSKEPTSFIENSIIKNEEVKHSSSSNSNNKNGLITLQQVSDINDHVFKKSKVTSPGVPRQLIKEAASLAGMPVPEDTPTDEKKISGKSSSLDDTPQIPFFDSITMATHQLYSSLYNFSKPSADPSLFSEAATASSSSSISTPSTINTNVTSTVNGVATSSTTTQPLPPSFVPATRSSPRSTPPPPPPSTTTATVAVEAGLSRAAPATVNLPTIPYGGMLQSMSDEIHYSNSDTSFGNDMNDIQGSIQSNTQTIDAAQRSVHAIAQDIDDLQMNVEALADNLGINPSQLMGNGDFSGFYDQFADEYSRLINSATQHDRNQLFELASQRYHQQQQHQHQHKDNGNSAYLHINNNKNNNNNNSNTNTMNGVSTHTTTSSSWQYGTKYGDTSYSANHNTPIIQNKTDYNWNTDASYAYNLAFSFLQQQLANKTIAARRASSASRPHRVPSPVLRTSVESSFCTSATNSSISQQQQQQQEASIHQSAIGSGDQQQPQPALVPVPVPVPIAMMSNQQTLNQQHIQSQAQAQQFAQQMSLQHQQQQRLPPLSKEYMAFLTAQAQQTYAGMAAAAAAAAAAEAANSNTNNTANNIPSGRSSSEMQQQQTASDNPSGPSNQ